ncbi:exodeoxyribonuclease III [Portibacter lacus]|uniref:Exodeoxyribonuclease n=1 Tax=Portibacter lacus TaxID=1099794 RepID=A0AA37WFC4_9BACT|nr:exodeoxyribonuclease III [Portibacter lacus]GLR16905.1 exodeoxyribonuclease [Portibacter lacus]
MKIVSWNVNGVRAAVKKNFINEVKDADADIYCIQETKAQDDQVSEALSDLEDFNIVSRSAVKKGYSGVATISKQEPMQVSAGIGKEEHMQEGRVLTTEHDHFFLVNVYVPNSGAGLKKLDYRSTWDKDFANYLADLKKKKPVIVTGDFNVAHSEIDLANPKSNYNKTSGYTQVEIDGMTGLQNVGLVDSFRKLHPEKVQYSFWSMRTGARARNAGWRLDYFLVDERLSENIVAAEIHDQIMGSDHCPISLELKF